MNGQCRGSRGLLSIGMSVDGTPLVAKAVPCTGYAWWSDRNTVTRFSNCAVRGKISPMRTPGMMLGIEPSSPRTSTGASGFGSKVSIWLGEPHR